MSPEGRTAVETRDEAAAYAAWNAALDAMDAHLEEIRDGLEGRRPMPPDYRVRAPRVPLPRSLRERALRTRLAQDDVEVALRERVTILGAALRREPPRPVGATYLDRRF